MLARAVRVLEALAAGRPPQSVRALADRTGLSKSAVQRILADLVDTDLASRDPATRHYALGPRTLALGMAYQRRVDVRRAALPHLRRLRDATGETVGVSVGLADQVVHVDQVESESRLRAQLEIGRPLPLWYGAPARLLLTVRSPAQVDRILVDRATVDVEPANPPSARALRADVERVRATGVARAFEETLPGVSTISVPVLGAAGDLVAVLSLTAPSIRLSDERIEQLLPDVLAAAAAVSTDLGCLPGVDPRSALVPPSPERGER